MTFGIVAAESEIKFKPKSKIEILFAYNANSGLFNALTDYVHRQITPSTYNCNLCLITYDNWDRNERWATYIDSLPVEVNFTYKNTISQYKNLEFEVQLPMAFLIENNNVSIFITAEELNSCVDENALIDMFESKLKKSGIIE